MISGVSEILINTWKPDVVMNESNVYLCKKKKKRHTNAKTTNLKTINLPSD